MTITLKVVSSAIVALLIYDAYAVLHGGLTNTISYQIAELSKAYPAIPFTLGVLMGHFFFNIGGTK